MWNFEGSLAGVTLVDTDGTALRCDLSGVDQLGIVHKTKSTLMADGVTVRHRFLLNTSNAKKQLVLITPWLPVAKLAAIEAAINAAMAAFASFRLQGTNASRTVDLAVNLMEIDYADEETDGYVGDVKITLEVDGAWV
jgi:hypothetical protein